METPPAVNRGADEAAAEGAQESTAEAPKRVRLKVVVLPFGDVIIDGRQMGEAPVTTRLLPGRHRIVAVTPGGRVRRHVDLKAGKPRTIEFE